MPKTKKKKEKLETRFRGAWLFVDLDDWIQAKIDARPGTKFQPWLVAALRKLQELDAKGIIEL